MLENGTLSQHPSLDFPTNCINESLNSPSGTLHSNLYDDILDDEEVQVPLGSPTTEQIQKQLSLGYRTTGQIFEVVNRPQDQRLACKTCPSKDSYEREKRILTSIKAKIRGTKDQKLFGLIQNYDDSKQTLYFKLGICNLQELIQERIKKRVLWKDEEIYYILISLMNMVKLLADIGIYHGDLKSDNILI